MQKMVKRLVGFSVGFLIGGSALTGTAGAHVLTVNNGGNGAVQEGRWVGGRGAAHGKGLVTACEAHHAHGHSAALIDTPWNSPENCEHGGH